MTRKEKDNEMNDEKELLEFVTIGPDSLIQPGWKYFHTHWQTYD